MLRTLADVFREDLSSSQMSGPTFRIAVVWKTPEEAVAHAALTACDGP